MIESNNKPSYKLPEDFKAFFTSGKMDSIKLEPEDRRFFVGGLADLNGLPVVLDNTWCSIRKRVQFRFPKSKKSRIRKKWSKRPKNWRVQKVGERIYMLPNSRTVYVGEKMMGVINNLPTKEIKNV